MLTGLRGHIISPLSLRIFTKNFASTLLSLRLPLKNWDQGISYSSYVLPFIFDKLSFVTHRVEAKSLDFFFDREQRKYLISYDLGSKKHLRISSANFMYFKRYFSFGRIAYDRGSMINFFSTLNKNAHLYVPVTNLPRAYILPNYSWYMDSLFFACKKRFSFYKKLQTQTFDLDLMVTLNNTSLKTTFVPLLPTRYDSFLVSSFTEHRPLRFAARYFRYFYKYNLRRCFWSQKLYSWWNNLGVDVTSIMNYNFFHQIAFKDNLNWFFQFKLSLRLFDSLFFMRHYFFYAPLGRFFFSSLLSLIYDDGFILPFFAYLLLGNSFQNNYHDLILDCTKKGNLVFLNKFTLRRYVVIKLASSLNVIGRHGFYRPWRNRFAFSLRNYTFLNVYNQGMPSRRLNMSARKSFSKNVYKRDWFIYDSFHIAHRRARKIFGKFIIFFLTRQNYSANIFTRLPFLLKGFFKFFSKSFKGSSPNFAGFITKFTDNYKSFIMPHRLIDSAHMPLNLLSNSISDLAKLLLSRFNNKKNIRLLSFLQKITAKEILHFLKTLHFFTNTSSKLASKIRCSSMWRRDYPLARRINSNYARIHNFLLVKRIYMQGINGMRTLSKLMQWHFNLGQITRELRYLASGLNINNILKPLLKQWVPPAVFKSRLIIGKFLRSQPLILNWFLNSLRLALSNFISIGNQFNNHLVSLVSFNIPSFLYWSKLWNNLVSENIFSKTLSLKSAYQWDFLCSPYLNSTNIGSDLVGQRVFFLLNTSSKVINEGVTLFNFSSRRRLKRLSSKVLSLLELFEQDQLVFKHFLEKEEQLAENSKDIKQEDQKLQTSFENKPAKKKGVFSRKYEKDSPVYLSNKPSSS